MDPLRKRIEGPRGPTAGSRTGHSLALFFLLLGAFAMELTAQESKKDEEAAKSGEEVPDPAEVGEEPAGGIGAPPAGEEPATGQPAAPEPPAGEGAAQPPAQPGQPGAQPQPDGAPPPGETRILPRSPEFRDARVDIGAGEIEVLELLNFLADYTGLPVIIDSSNPQLQQQKILIAASMRDVTADLVIAILKANKFLITRQVLASEEVVLNVISQQTAAGPPPEPEETPVIQVSGGVVQGIPDQLKQEVKNLRPDEIATMVFTLKYTQPTDAIQSLNALVGGAKQAAGRTQAFSVVDVKNSMMVIITAKFGLLNYLAKLLSIIDVPLREPERIIQIIEVENADADELSNLIMTFLQGRAGTGSRFGGRPGAAPAIPGQPGQPATVSRSSTGDFQTNLIPDWRTQKIIVETYSERDLEDIHMLVRELDARFDIRRLKTRMYQVRYLKAEEVASDLQILLGSSGGGFSGRASLGARGAGAQTGGVGGRGARGRQSGVPRVGQRAGATTGGPTPSVPGAAGGGQNAPMPALIVPHVPTNSLIIQAEPEEYAEIINILDQIDIKRRQVFLEAALVQVTSTSNLNYRIELLAGEPDDRATRLLFESSFGLSGIDFEEFNRTIPDLATPGSVPTGALMALMHRGKFPALIQFFKSNTDSQVLATPFILADDNQPNIIDIIETRYVQNTATGSSQVTTTSQQGEDAGITLEITPTISSQKAVYLEMTLEVSQFEGTGAINLLPPKITNTLTSAVTVPDGEIFVIGGLTRENKSKSVSKVPILGDIPLIGKLFRAEESAKSASNLYIFLRAHVLTHPEFDDGKDLTRKTLGFMEEFAPNLNPVRFEKPNVRFPPAPAQDLDEPRRYQRSKYTEGREAPLGPFRRRQAEPGRPGYDERDSERPDRGDRGTRPEPRTAPPPQSERARPGEPQEIPDGGIETPPLTPAPSAESVEADRRNPRALEGTDMEVDPAGDSWLVPLRPKR